MLVKKFVRDMQDLTEATKKDILKAKTDERIVKMREKMKKNTP